MLILKNTLNAFDRRYGKKLIFFNDLCFYNHIRKLPLNGTSRETKVANRKTNAASVSHAPATVDELLDQLEPFLPLALTDETFTLFMQAVQDLEHLTDDFPEYFMYKARIDFVVALHNANHPSQWERLLNTCDAIRDLKAEWAHPY